MDHRVKPGGDEGSMRSFNGPVAAGSGIKTKSTRMARRKKHGRRGLFHKRTTPEEEVAQREAAFAAIRRLYCEALPLWRSCARPFCRRHRRCGADDKGCRACLARAWPLLPAAEQNRAHWSVSVGGPRRLPPATHMEWALRRYPPSNFVH